MHDVMIWVTVGGFISVGMFLFVWAVCAGADDPAEDETEFDAGMARWEGVNYENLR